MRVGDTVAIRGPRNAFPLALPGYGSSARTLRFVAAGIGITPILPMLAMADRYGLEWTMLYCGRSPESIPFIDELARALHAEPLAFRGARATRVSPLRGFGMFHLAHGATNVSPARPRCLSGRTGSKTNPDGVLCRFSMDYWFSAR